MKIFREEDYFGNHEVFCHSISDDELRQICELKPEDILAHMEKSIGKMTPLGPSKFIPAIMLGKLEISVQINYQLWSEREDGGRLMEPPITRQEFDILVPDVHYRNIDVRVLYDGRPFIKPTQMSLKGLCDCLGEAIIGD
jgi:hypothetical protein